MAVEQGRIYDVVHHDLGVHFPTVRRLSRGVGEEVKVEEAPIDVVLPRDGIRYVVLNSSAGAANSSSPPK